MELSVDRKEDVKVTRQPRRYPVIKTNRILAGDRRLDLMEITGLHTAAKDRPILSENGLEEAMRISSSSLTLQICQPIIRVRQINTLAQAETIRRRVSKRSHMLHKAPVDLLLRFPVCRGHDIEPRTVWFNPFSSSNSQKVLSSWYSEARLAMIFLRALSGTGVR